LYQLTHDLHFYQNNTRSKADVKNLVASQKNLDTYYTLSKLKLACELKVRQNTFIHSIDIPLLNEIIEFSEASEISNDLYALYSLAIKNLESTNDNESFETFKDLYFRNLSVLSEREQLSLFLIILNINGMLLNKGKTQNFSGQLDLYKKAINEKIIIVNNRITSESFTNIVMLAAQLKEFKWAENFIKSYKKYLDPYYQERTIAYSKGYIAYRKGDYEDAIETLWNCKFNQLPFDIRTKSIIVRALFEQFSNNPDKYDFCWVQIQTIERYIRRKKDLTTVKSEAYLNFIKTTKKLINLKRKGKFTDIEIKKLQHKIINQPNLVGKPWLLQKLK